ncbi:alpha/beta hydrolase [Streptomyces sp. ME02-8801-2C]|uniref:alpha/beta fold hydrolase n=1 Tax=Streptomyces sp. ME02-8801-2C TaxID=3028680 RepID=UPI0029B3B15D|nr:alpha/beta hydrolase [Streptomyces sp. ME02-8801-2C]MDX3457680.1 alpha/beta hydrolase [Streptomyces sp. ME02-8801-2C]
MASETQRPPTHSSGEDATTGGSSAGDGIRRRTIQAGGREVPILEAGSGPLVLCLHGFPDHAGSWAGMLDRLAQDGYWAVAPAQRGYWPDGAAPDGSYRASATGQDVLDLIEALGRDRADLIGHDLGARAAYAAASLDATRVRKIVGMAVPYGPQLRTAWLTDGDQQRRSWYMFFFQTALAEPAVALDDFAFIDRLWREWSPGYELPDAERAALKETLRAPGVLTEILGYYRQLFSPPAEEAARALEARASGAITIPALYLHGADDNCFSVEVSDGMDAVFKKGLERVVVPRAGHFLHLEQPKQVADHILSFLDN